MLFAEVDAEHDAHDEESGEEGDVDGIQLAVMKVSEVGEQDTDDDVQDAPEHIDDGRGESAARRFGEGRGEGFSADAFDEVRDGVCEEGSGKEACDVGVPKHARDCSTCGGR